MMILLLYKDATLNRSFCSIHVRIAARLGFGVKFLSSYPR